MTASFELYSLDAYRRELEKINRRSVGDAARKLVSRVVKDLQDSEGRLSQTDSSFSVLLSQLEDDSAAETSDAATTAEDLFVAIVRECRLKNLTSTDDDSYGLIRFSKFFEDYRSKADVAGVGPEELAVESSPRKDEILERCEKIDQAIRTRNELIVEYGDLIARGFRRLNERAVYDQRVSLKKETRLMAFLRRIVDRRKQRAKVEPKVPDEVPLSQKSIAVSGSPTVASRQSSAVAEPRVHATTGGTTPVQDCENLLTRKKGVLLDSGEGKLASGDGETQADDVLSEYKRAWACEMGTGNVRRNLNEASRWYRLAVEHGDGAARSGLRNLCAYATEGFDFASVAKWCRDLATEGDSWAQELMGWLYEEGRGVSKNKTRAIEWYKKAAVQKNDEAKRALRRLQG